LNMKVNEKIYLSAFEDRDEVAFVEHLQERQIYEQTLAIPWPYGSKDAKWWINYNREFSAKHDGVPANWAIRRQEDNFLIGCVGYHDHVIGSSHRAEIGYWLAKPFWGQGIMTEVVTVMTDYGFEKLGLLRITANVFKHNLGSARVLEKAGYTYEGTLRSHYKKDGKLFDGKMYAKLKAD
jgi:[ribosomal protein S5]-alanine N-acetyltransferase